MLFAGSGASAHDRIFTEQGIWNNRFAVPLRPLAITVCLRNTLGKHSAVQLGKVFIEALHLQLPLALSDQWSGADNKHRGKTRPCLQFLQDQSGFDGFTDTDIIRHQDTRAVCLDHPERRPKLIWNKIDSGRIQGIQV